MPNLTSSTPAVGTSPGPMFYFLDIDPVNERPAKRFRITGESSADKRARDAFGDLPTPERWKRFVLQVLGIRGMRLARHLSFFFA